MKPFAPSVLIAVLCADIRFGIPVFCTSYSPISILNSSFPGGVIPPVTIVPPVAPVLVAHRDRFREATSVPYEVSRCVSIITTGATITRTHGSIARLCGVTRARLTTVQWCGGRDPRFRQRTWRDATPRRTRWIRVVAFTIFGTVFVFGVGAARTRTCDILCVLLLTAFVFAALTDGRPIQ